jgi:hypothetical protein
MPDTVANDFDLLENIWSVSRSWQITFEHVKGYQDDESAVDKLPLDAQFNFEADKLAGRAHRCGCTVDTHRRRLSVELW